jgi:carbamate kinase
MPLPAADKPVLLVALGGNALIRKGQKGTAQEQLENLRTPVAQIAALAQNFRIIITHGNGPQVGNLLLQQESCRQIPRLPLEILVAQTQGQIGYMIESVLDSELMKMGIHAQQKLVSLISYVVVDPQDPAFADPSKPIGPILDSAVVSTLPYPTRKTAKGFRRVVISPQPVTIVEKREIKKLIEMNFIVICCGGGGIPVIRDGRGFAGVDAVIDKDLASAKLAQEVGVDMFIIATDVPGVFINFGQPDQRQLDRITAHQAKRYLQQNQFPTGTMGPKIEAAIRFMRQGGRRAVITAIDEIARAAAGKAGTQILV